MSFDPKYDIVYHSGIKKAVEENGLECIRLDDDFIPKNIPTKMVRDIIDSDLVIADISEVNPNVYYELGISHAVGNKTIIISQNLEHLPFDVRNEYTIGYSNTREGIRLLYFELTTAIGKMIRHPDDPSNIVQIAGRDFFDFKNKIKQNLRQIAEDRTRTHEFKKYLSSERKTDNSEVVDFVSKEILKEHRKSTNGIFIGISGGAGLGKTTLTAELISRIGEIDTKLKVDTLPLDAFMMDRAQRLLNNLSGYNSKATNIDAIEKSIRSLGSGESVRYNPYNHFTGEHEKEEKTIQASDIVIVDGTHSFHPLILQHLKLKIFLYATPPDAKELRFLTDLFERNYSVHKAYQHSQDEYANFEEHILHYIKFADIVIQVDNYWKYKM